MIAFLKALVLLPIALLVILLAVANRAPVLLSFDPFAKGPPDLALSAPLYGVLLAAVAVGMLLGGAATWLSSGRGRRQVRSSRREIQRLKSETERLRAELATQRAATGRPADPAQPERLALPARRAA